MATITTEQLKEFLFSLRFYEYSCHHSIEVEKMVKEFGLSIDDVSEFKIQQKKIIRGSKAKNGD